MNILKEKELCEACEVNPSKGTYGKFLIRSLGDFISNFTSELLNLFFVGGFFYILGYNKITTFEQFETFINNLLF